MSITSSKQRQQVVEWSQGIRDVLQQRGDQTAVEGVDKALAQHQDDKFMIAVLGKAKRGKSTLLNAILGRRDDTVAPIDKLPASSAITRFGWAADESATVFFRDGHQESIGYDRIREFVTEESNPENTKCVDIVEVLGPFPGLDQDLVLVDTPGAGSIHEHHDAILHAFIPQADAVIFLVTARMPLDQDELDLLKNVKAADISKIFFAVNRIDESTESDLEAAVEHNRKLLAQVGVSVKQIHRISARNAYRGQLAGSGVPELLAEISDFLAANKGRVLDARLVSRVCQSAEPVAQALAVEVASASKTTAEVEADLTRLRDTKRNLEQERGLTEREFQLAWERAVDGFDREVKEARNDVKASVAKRIASTSLMGVRGLAKELPTILTRAVEERLAAPAQQFEEASSAAAQKLQASYPTIEVKSAGEVTVRSREGHTVVVAGLGGAAAIATGFGLAAAGSAAIAAANAAALAATTSVAAPSIIASLGGMLGGVPGGILAWLGTGSATVAAPAAAMPLWVALAGPVGWTLAGLGVLVVPFAWRASKLKQKDQLEDASREQIEEIFKRIQTERIPALRKMGTTILEDFRLRLDRQLIQIEEALNQARDHRPSPQQAATSQQLNQALHQLLAAVPQPADQNTR